MNAHRHPDRRCIEDDALKTSTVDFALSRYRTAARPGSARHVSRRRQVCATRYQTTLRGAYDGPVRDVSGRSVHIMKVISIIAAGSRSLMRGCGAGVEVTERRSQCLDRGQTCSHFIATPQNPRYASIVFKLWTRRYDARTRSLAINAVRYATPDRRPCR